MSLKDPAYELTKAYYTALKNNITVDGSIIPVSSVDDTNTGGHRIIIRENSVIENSVKDNFMTDVTQSVEVITEFGKRGTKKKSYDIANLVMQKIQTGTGLSMTGFEIIVTELDNAIDLEELDDGKKIFRRILRFRHEIDQS
jgi:hypothetical protein